MPQGETGLGTGLDHYAAVVQCDCRIVHRPACRTSFRNQWPPPKCGLGLRVRGLGLRVKG